MPKRVFTADQFTPTEWSTAEDKAKFANQFVVFVESGFARDKFPKWFYTRLSMTFGNIAHYNQEGFYATWFMDTDSKMEFLQNVIAYPCYGSSSFTYSDVEIALQNWLAGVLAK